MGQDIVHADARVVCDHQAAASTQQGSQRVKISGKSVVTLSALYTVSGCPFSTNAGPMPCATIKFSTGAQRVKVEGLPLLLKSSTGQAFGPLPVQGTGTVQLSSSRVTAV